MTGVGSGGFQNVASRVGSGRVGSGRVGAGRVGSGQEVFKSRGLGRVGSDQEVWKSRRSGRVMTRETRVTRGSSHHDPRVVFGWPAGRTRG